ncbi:hypothetical protein Tco_1334034 [Tanacetum coccineum]
MTTSKLPSLFGMRSILKGWFSKIRVQPWITVLVPTMFPLAISMLWVVSSVIGRILSIEARDMDKKLLSAPESNNTLARCWFLPVAGPLFLQFLGKASSIPTVFSWGSSISPNSFLPSILLLLVIIVAVVIIVVVVVLVVVVVEGAYLVQGFYLTFQHVPLFSNVLLLGCGKHNTTISYWQPESWMWLQSLISSWEPFINILQDNTE